MEKEKREAFRYEDAKGTRRRRLLGLLLLKNDVHLFFIRANKESRTRNFASFIKSAARSREKCTESCGRTEGETRRGMDCLSKDSVDDEVLIRNARQMDVVSLKTRWPERDETSD